MPQPTSMTPLIPLPDSPHRPATVHDDKEDVFATLFSPATPRASPTLNPVPDELARPVRHSRSASVDSEFGSFVSVTSSEDPLHQADQEFSPLTKLEFFDRFTEDGKIATEKNKKGLLEELLQNEADPASFLRFGTSQTDLVPDQSLIGAEFTSSQPASRERTPSDSRSRTPLPPPAALKYEADSSSLFDQLSTARHPNEHGQIPLMTPAPRFKSPSPIPSNPPDDFVQEIVDHQDDPMYFSESRVDASLLDVEPSEDEHLERTSRHANRRANWTESAVGFGFGSELARAPSLPAPPIRASTPEVQRAQSFFTPSSLVTSSFPTRWMSSLLSRPAPPPIKTPENEAPVAVAAHGRAATFSGPSITHGTPFAAHPYLPPSGAPGFTGDRSWDKGFQFDKENVEKASIKLLGRKEATVGVLTASIADKIRPHLPALKRLPRSWSLLYSLDQHGISLNTLYTRCESHMGSALVIMRDSNDAIFGAWMGEGIKLSKGGYYGSGESFLWKILSDETLRVFKWTGKNDYVALCEPEYISFGGGDGRYGLYLDETLCDGSSARCPTFENEPLCSAGPRQGEGVTFECVGLEVWGVG